MERGEQKPSNLEVKLESEEFLFLDGYGLTGGSEEVMMKLEEIEPTHFETETFQNSTVVKIEPQDEVLQYPMDTLGGGVKLEEYEVLGEVKQVLMDDTEMYEDEQHLLLEADQIKLEEADWTEEESMDNDDFSEPVKLEEVDEEFSEITGNVLHDHNYCDPNPPKWKHLKLDNLYYGYQHQTNYLCGICTKRKYREDMKRVTIAEEKLVFMIVNKLKSGYESKEVNSPLDIPIYICYSHFSEAVDEIYEFLSVEKYKSITEASSNQLDRLMESVKNSHSEDMKFADFNKMFHQFMSRNWHLLTEDPSSKPPKLKKQKNESSKKLLAKAKRTAKPKRSCAIFPISGIPVGTVTLTDTVLDPKTYSWCSICQLHQSPAKTCGIRMKSEKLVVMVGYVLNGSKQVDEAKRFISEKFQFICRFHFLDSVNIILEKLNIKSPDPKVLIETLIANLYVRNIVKQICPNVTVRLFRNSVVATEWKYRETRNTQASQSSN